MFLLQFSLLFVLWLRRSIHFKTSTYLIQLFFLCFRHHDFQCTSQNHVEHWQFALLFRYRYLVIILLKEKNTPIYLEKLEKLITWWYGTLYNAVFFFILQAVLADLTTLQVIPLIQLSLFSKWVIFLPDPHALPKDRP